MPLAAREHELIDGAVGVAHLDEAALIIES